VQCRFFEEEADIMKKNRLHRYGSYEKKNAAAIEVVYLVAQKTAETNTTHNSRRADTSLSVY
jgi:hypothetical protein